VSKTILCNPQLFIISKKQQFRHLISRQNCSSASDFAYSYPFLHSVVCHLSSVCHLSHLCTLLKPLDGFTWHLSGTLGGSMIHCVRWE